MDGRFVRTQKVASSHHLDPPWGRRSKFLADVLMDPQWGRRSEFLAYVLMAWYGFFIEFYAAAAETEFFVFFDFS